jgi:hypothetical protein
VGEDVQAARVAVDHHGVTVHCAAPGIYAAACTDPAVGPGKAICPVVIPALTSPGSLVDKPGISISRH